LESARVKLELRLAELEQRARELLTRS